MDFFPWQYMIDFTQGVGRKYNRNYNEKNALHLSFMQTSVEFL